MRIKQQQKLFGSGKRKIVSFCLHCVVASLYEIDVSECSQYYCGPAMVCAVQCVVCFIFMHSSQLVPCQLTLFHCFAFFHFVIFIIPLYLFIAFNLHPNPIIFMRIVNLMMILDAFLSLSVSCYNRRSYNLMHINA